jgi:hypothetical protein
MSLTPKKLSDSSAASRTHTSTAFIAWKTATSVSPRMNARISGGIPPSVDPHSMKEKRRPPGGARPLRSAAGVTLIAGSPCFIRRHTAWTAHALPPYEWGMAKRLCIGGPAPWRSSPMQSAIACCGPPVRVADFVTGIRLAYSPRPWHGQD